MKAEPEGAIRPSKDYHDHVLSWGQEAREIDDWRGLAGTQLRDVGVSSSCGLVWCWIEGVCVVFLLVNYFPHTPSLRVK